MADFRDHVYQRVFLQFWVHKIWVWCCREIHSSHVPGLENGDIIDLRFPSIPISWWGHNKRRAAGDFVWNSDIFLWQLKHLETSLFTTLFSRLSYFHSRRRRKPFKMSPTRHSPGTPASMWGKPCCRSGPGRFWSVVVVWNVAICCHEVTRLMKLMESLVVEVLFNVWSVTSVTRIGKPKHRCCIGHASRKQFATMGQSTWCRRRTQLGLFLSPKWWQ